MTDIFLNPSSPKRATLDQFLNETTNWKLIKIIKEDSCLLTFIAQNSISPVALNQDELKRDIFFFYITADLKQLTDVDGKHFDFMKRSFEMTWKKLTSSPDWPHSIKTELEEARVPKNLRPGW